MSKNQKYLLVVGGPTASGKTNLAIQLAQHFSTVILSADSRQFYREMKIGNARPREQELAAVPHLFIADRSVTEPLSAGAFAREAMPILEETFRSNDYVVLSGGSGLFLRALTEGLDEFPEISLETRAKVDELYRAEGLSGLQAALEAADPAYYEEVDRQNPVRLCRALEVFYETGKPFSSFRGAKQADHFFTPIYLQPDWLRPDLYKRINQRVEVMFEAGLQKEVKTLEEHRNLPTLQTVGYQEWWAYFAGEQSKERTLELIQQNTRRYAKRQLSWNRRDGYWKRIPQADLRTALTYIHLVRQERLQLTAFSAAEVPPIIHGKEQRLRLALIHEVTAEVTAVADLAFWKEAVFLRYWFKMDLPHIAQAVLLHEACNRAETENVLTIANTDKQAELLASLGWQESSNRSKLPADLQEKQTNAKLWEWRRSTQAF